MDLQVRLGWPPTALDLCVDLEHESCDVGMVNEREACQWEQARGMLVSAQATLIDSPPFSAFSILSSREVALTARDVFFFSQVA
jgi:hypothetical protein